MTKIITKKEIIPILIIMSVIAASVIMFSRLPDSVPSHWNINGQADGYAGKNFTVIFFPSLIIAMYLLLTFLPFIDPLRKNIEQFAVPYFWLRTVLVSFLSLLYFYTLYAGITGIRAFPINMFIMPALGVMFIVIGYLLPKFKKNYFIGIRTPWTLHSEEVWNLTHKRARKWYVGAGILLIPSGFLKTGGWIMAVMILFLLWPVADSYFIYRRLKK